LLTSNLRCVRIFNNQLYVSSGAANPGIGVHSVGTGLPTNGTQTTIQLITVGGASPSPYQFEFNPGLTVAYVADDRNNAAGGIKYTNNGVAWSSNYTLPTIATANVGARGLAVDWSGENPVIYATTAEANTNRLIRIVDTNSAATAATLAMAPTNTAFRSLAFAPVNSLVRPTILSQAVLGDGSFQMTFSAPAGQSFKVAATANLTQPVASWTILTNGVFGLIPVTYADTGAIGQSQRFYLVISP
jgi:hypothetical protein